ncbi:MAG: hypothetical protein H0X38_04410, partial [Planctomycetes bacterium]|nr:hypothetical protein [Planctomycetota bacterium]
MRPCGLSSQRVPLALLLALACAGGSAVASEPPPTSGADPAGPVLVVRASDVPRLRARFAASWYGTLAARALDDAGRQRLRDLIAQGADRTGIDLMGLCAHLTGLTVAMGQEAVFRLDLDAPAAPLLQGVPAAAARDRQRADRIIAQNLVAYVRMRLGQSDDYHAVQVPERVPAQAAGDGVVLGRTRTHWGTAAQDGVLLAPRGTTLLGGAAAAELSAVDADAADATVKADALALIASLGVPGAVALARASGVGALRGALSLASGRSDETLELPGAHLPLRALDTAVLEAEVPADALALSAIGIDGTALAALAARVAAAPLVADAWGTDTQVLAQLDGPAWLAITPGLPLPDAVFAVPAGPALDAWLHTAWPDDGGRIEAARQAPVEITPRWPGMPLWIRRSARAWLVATDEHILAHLGNPGLAGRLHTQHHLPAGALALALQANQAILQRVGALVPIVRAALALHALTGAALPVPFLDEVDAADAGAILDLLAAAAGTPQVPTSLAWLEADASGVTMRGHDLVIGAGVLPTAAVLAAALPQAFPDATIQLHPLLAALIIANHHADQGVELSSDVLLTWRRAIGGMPAMLEQACALATGSPFAAVRAAALEALPAASSGAADARLLPWLRAGLA